VVLPLQDRDHMPGDVLQDLRILERAALGWDGHWLHVYANLLMPVGRWAREVLRVKPSGFQAFIQGSETSSGSWRSTPSISAARRHGSSGCVEAGAGAGA